MDREPIRLNWSLLCQKKHKSFMGFYWYHCIYCFALSGISWMDSNTEL